MKLTAIPILDFIELLKRVAAFKPDALVYRRIRRDPVYLEDTDDSSD